MFVNAGVTGSISNPRGYGDGISNPHLLGTEDKARYDQGRMDIVARVIGLWLLVMAASYTIGVALGLIYGLISTATSKLLRFWNDHERGPQRRGAHEVVEGDVATLLHELSQRAKIPTPRLYVVDRPLRQCERHRSRLPTFLHLRLNRPSVRA